MSKYVIMKKQTTVIFAILVIAVEFALL